MTPVKDVMTLLQAFGFAKEREPALKLWIMGTWEEDSEYAQECFDLVNTMGIQDVEFTGNVDMQEYYGRMDMTILTSISEGQPLVILESFAAHKPVIATNVGNCRGLILGEQDDFDPAGIVTRIMNVEDTAYAMTALAGNEEMRVQMGRTAIRESWLCISFPICRTLTEIYIKTLHKACSCPGRKRLWIEKTRKKKARRKQVRMMQIRMVLRKSRSRMQMAGGIRGWQV